MKLTGDDPRRERCLGWTSLFSNDVVDLDNEELLLDAGAKVGVFRMPARLLTLSPEKWFRREKR